jgi:hypothetical protein
MTFVYINNHELQGYKENVVSSQVPCPDRLSQLEIFHRFPINE